MNLRTLLAAFLVVLSTTTILRPSTVVAEDPPDVGGRQFQWSNGFGFQGRLTRDGVPANGTFNFQFLLYDDQVAGMQVYGTLSQTLTVTNGVFNTQLFFDNALDSGDEYWVEVRVKQPADAGYTLLNPRQPLFAAPYAQVAAGLPPGTIIKSEPETNGLTYQFIEANRLAYGGLVSDSPQGVAGVAGVGYGAPGVTARGGYFQGTTAGVEAISDSGYGVYGSTDESAKAGVLGRHNGATCSGGTGEYSMEQYCYGVAGVAYTSTTHGIGVYGYGSNTGVWGVSATPEAYSGYFSVGDVGYGAGVAHLTASDRNLKRDITPLSANLDALLRLKPSSYAWKSEPESEKRDYGFIAQDVQEVLPELVSTTMEGDLALDYNGFIPVIVGGVQELEDRISQLESGSPADSASVPGTTTIATSTLAALLLGGMAVAAAMGGVTGVLVTRRRR